MDLAAEHFERLERRMSELDALACDEALALSEPSPARPMRPRPPAG